MSKKQYNRIFGGLKYRLHEMLSLGESKHQYKKVERENYAKAHNGSLKGWNPTSVPGKIFSVGTYLSYEKSLSTFSKWLSENTTVKNANQIEREHAIRFLKEKDMVCSAYTVSLYMSSISKIYPEFQLSKESVGIRERSLKDISRSRHETRNDKYNAIKYEREIYFATGTGTRRRELEALTPRNIIRDSSGRAISVLIQNGKGGKQREAPILKSHQERITAIVDERLQQDPSGTRRLFGKLSSTLDVHACRAMYCNLLLEDLEQANSNYEDNLRTVSQAMGHNRTRILKEHYLR